MAKTETKEEEQDRMDPAKERANTANKEVVGMAVGNLEKDGADKTTASRARRRVTARRARARAMACTEWITIGATT